MFLSVVRTTAYWWGQKASQIEGTLSVPMNFSANNSRRIAGEQRIRRVED
jgi:hypothetical protein